MMFKMYQAFLFCFWPWRKRTAFTLGLVPENLKPEPEKIVLNPNSKINIPICNPKLTQPDFLLLNIITFTTYYTVSFMNSNHHHLHQFIVFFLSALPPISNLSLIALRSAPQEVLKYACMKAIFSWNGTSENCHYLYNMYYTHMQTYK